MPSNNKDVNALYVNKNNHKFGTFLQNCLMTTLSNHKYLLTQSLNQLLENRRNGPEQQCNMGFRCLDENINKVRAHLSGHFVLKVV